MNPDRFRRRAVAAVAACLVLLAGFAPGASGADRVKVTSKGQRALAKSFVLRVAFAAPRPGNYRLTVKLRRPGAGRAGGQRPTAKVRRAGRRRVAVRLGPTARALVGACTPLRATVVVRRRGGRVVGRARRLLSARDRRCGASAGKPPVPAGVQTADFERCDFLDPSLCLYPFPNDHFTTEDAGTPTGRRLRLDPDSMPRNKAGKPIDPTDMNVSDGFGPGQAAVTRVPGLDSPEAFRATGAAPIDDPARSLRRDAPIAVVNARTRRPHLVWTEIDSNPAAPEDRTLTVRPAVNFDEGRRYVVALRRLRDAKGAPIAVRREFRLYRDRIVTTDEDVEARRPHMESLFRTLSAAGIARDDLYLAWDFTVASARSTTQRMLSIRDRAFAELGDTDLADRVVQGAPPEWRLNPDIPDFLPDEQDLDGVRNLTAEQDERIARVVRGTITVPCFLDAPGCPTGSRFAYGSDPLEPQRLPGNTQEATFTCLIPRRALDPAGDPERLRPNLYGHGLFGGQGEVFQGQQKSLAQEHGFLPCATDWEGMATKDVPNALTVLQDLSRFPTLIDHVQQGYLWFLYLGRLMVHPEGFASNPAFQDDGKPVIDTSRLFYDGNSQGGIYGGALTAVAPDFERAVLGVPGMNYSTLLSRSVDFDTYANGSAEGVDSPEGGLYDNYPNELERPLIFGLMQILWDRADPNGYAHHMTSDPLPNTPSHKVLLHVGLGDHQVADVTAQVEARTIGARVHQSALEPQRPRFSDRPYPDAGPDRSFFGLAAIPAGGHDGSGLVFWDIGPLRTEEGEELGTPPPPATNVPPRKGKDPHEAPRNTKNGRRQKSEFLRDGGTIVDVCAGGPCFAFDYTGGAGGP